MSLIIEKIKIKWHSSNKKHFESLGYKWTKKGEEFEVWSNELSLNSKIKIHCNCDKCKTILSWTYQDYNNQVKENGETYCQKCAMKLYGRENNIKNRIDNGNTTTFYDWCIKNSREDLLLRWDYELNGCSPKDVCYSSNLLYYFKCLENSKHKPRHIKLNTITSKNNYSLLCYECNSIAQYILDNFPNKKLEEVWDYEKNEDLDPWIISVKSNKKCWFICQEKDYHESYEMSCANFSSGHRCPYCTGKKIHPKDSIGQLIIDDYGEDFLNIVWSNKNTMSPFTLAPNSNKKVWWSCLEGRHEDYLRTCSGAVKYEFRCPECVKERKESMIEEKTRLYLEELGYEVKTEYRCNLIPKNPKTNKFLPFDNEIILENGKHLIIEVHGQQHYYKPSDTSKFLEKGQTPKEYLHQRKLYDRYKRIKCIQAGYEYLEIPYWYFYNEAKTTYKNLIDNKIKEILNK